MDVDEFIKMNGKAQAVADAGFLVRLGSFIFDLLLLNIFCFSIIGSVISVDALSIDQAVSVVESQGFGKVMLMVFFASLVALAYFSLLEYSASQTIGMMLFGIRVDGNPGFMKCLVRNIFIIPVFPLTILWIVEPLLVIFRKRRLLEEISSTRTVRVK